MDEIEMEANGMTVNELKKNLYHSFRQKGLVDSLKSQLRTKLVHELRGSSTIHRTSHSSSETRIQQDDEGTLMQRAANSLVADHLRRCRYEYSLAVFLPESETGKDKMFTVRELMGILAIRPESQLFRRLTEKLRGYHPKGLLWQLLCELTSTCGQSHEKAVQVNHLPTHLGSVEKKLTAVDELFDHEGYDSSKQGLQGKLLSYQRKMEARNKEDIAREISRFKESEGKRIELEEREKCRLEISKARTEMERTYQSKVESLQERERSTFERIQRHQEMVERETYSQRQSLLDELQTLKQKEAELKREAELNQRAMKLEESRRKTTEENLKMRESSLAQIEDMYDKRYKDHIRKHEVEQQDKFTMKIRGIEEGEARLREDQNHLDREKEVLGGLKEEVKERKSRIAELELLYQQSRYESVAVSKRNEVLTERLKDMIDYHTIKEDNAVLRQELHNEKRRLAEVINELKIERTRYEESMKGMTEKISQPSPEVITLQAELQRAKTQLDQEKNLLQHKEAQYRTSLQKELDYNKELKRQLDDQGSEMQQMQNQIADMRHTLTQTQLALSNELYRKPTTQGSHSRSHQTGYEFPEHDSLNTVDHYMETLQLQPTRNQQVLFEDSDDSELAPIDPLAFLENTKARFQQLEREAEILEQNYQSFQHGITNVHALPISPPQRYDGQSSSLVDARNTLWNNKGSVNNGPVKTHSIPPSPLDLNDVNRSIPASQSNVQSSPSHEKFTSSYQSRRHEDQDTSQLLHIDTHKTQYTPSPVASPASSVTSVKDLKPDKLLPVQTDNLEAFSPSVKIPGNSASAEFVSSKINDEDTNSEIQDSPVVDNSHQTMQTDEALRVQLEEEEREWEEKHKKREDERRLREEEARDREQAMLLELQRQETGEHPKMEDEEAVKPSHVKTSSDSEEQRNPPEDLAEDVGVKIDPIMQKYMQMIKDKKEHQSEPTEPSQVPSQSEPGYDIEDVIEQQSSTGHISDNSEDPFDDW